MHRLVFWVILTNIICVYADNIDGFNKIRAGYYVDALDEFGKYHDSISELGIQYSYLLMNNVHFNYNRTLDLLLSVDIPDSIYESIVLTLEGSIHNDSLKNAFRQELSEKSQRGFPSSPLKFEWKNIFSGDSLSTFPHLDRVYEPNFKFDLSLFSIQSRSKYRTHRDTLSFLVHSKYITNKERLNYYFDLARYDSIANHSWNVAIFFSDGYIGDLVAIASIYKEERLLHLEEKYLKNAYCEITKGSLLLEKRHDTEKILIQLVDNLCRQTKYIEAFEYENKISDLNTFVYGFNEDNYFDFVHVINGPIKCLSGYMGTFREWSWEVYGLAEHLFRKATIMYNLQNHKEALHICVLADSIINSYDNYLKIQADKIKYDSYPHCLRAKCLLKLGFADEAQKELLSAFNQSIDFYWNISVLPQRGNFGPTIYSENDRNTALREYDFLKELIYCSSFKINSPNFNRLCYNQCLFEKNILLTTSNLIDRLAIESNNWRYFNIIRLKNELDKRNNIFEKDSIDDIIQREERWLINELSPLLVQEGQSSIIYNVDDVIHTLSNENAIEFFTAPLDEDSTMYCALLLRDTCSYPIMIPIFEEKEVLSLATATTKGKIAPDKVYGYTANGKELAEKIWSKIMPYIKPGETVYFAPSGLLHQLAIEALPYDSTHTMADIYNMVRLSSTREIVMHKNDNHNTTATLYGGIQYDMDTTILKAESKKYPEVATNRGIEEDTLNRGEITHLEWTQTEVENINSMLKHNNLQVQLFTSTKANEESFKALSGKHQNILHIATHGFFWSDSTAQKKEYFSQRMMTLGNSMPSPPTIDPLNRCGLLFAGAQTAWSGHSSELPEGVQDGILTALEISLLNLRDADLVVLSACETGKGEITGDGVFGLQRAFKQAGAQTIIMSLWPVNDEATQYFMTEFYRNWITNHQSKREAFRNAQNTIRAKYEEPVYWAGFIMLD